LVAAGISITACVISYNVLNFGHIEGAYHRATIKSGMFTNNPLEGVAGLLLSPARGLFVFSPFLLALPLGLWWILRCDHERVLTRCLLVGIAATVIVYAPTPWHAGHSYGPRYMVDLVPAMIWLIAPVVDHLSGMRRMAYIVVICFSVWVEYIGAFHYTSPATSF
jgi:hypothetical protein